MVKRQISILLFSTKQLCDQNNRNLQNKLAKTCKRIQHDKRKGVSFNLYTSLLPEGIHNK